MSYNNTVREEERKLKGGKFPPAQQLSSNCTAAKGRESLLALFMHPKRRGSQEQQQQQQLHNQIFSGWAGFR